MEIRSQLSVTLPMTDQSNPSDALKAVEEARQKLMTLSDREFDSVKAIYGADATLRSAGTNSNMQDSGYRGRTAFISVTNTYAVKKPLK